MTYGHLRADCLYTGISSGLASTKITKTTVVCDGQQNKVKLRQQKLALAAVFCDIFHCVCNN